MSNLFKYIRITLMILFIGNFSQMYGQPQTVTMYEKKKAELIVQVWSEFGQRAAAFVSSLSKKNDEDFFKSAKDADLAAGLLGYYTNEMKAIKWYAQELKKAQKLKNNLDFQREKEAIAKHENPETLNFNSEKENTFKDSREQMIDQQTYMDYTKRLDSIFCDFNRKLLKNQYNTGEKIMQTYDKMKKEGKAEENFRFCMEKIKSDFETLNNNFKIELKHQNPSQYCKIYYSLNPDRKIEADKKYLECRCDYLKRENFDIGFINGDLYGCNCRDNEYQKSGKLFISKSEYDSFYDKGVEVLQTEVAIREFKRQAPIIELLNFKDINNSGKSVGKSIIGDLTGLNNPENTQKEFTKDYIQKIANYKDKPYYSEITDFVIKINKGLNKEWSKNGNYFDNNVEFYEAYISDNYKRILEDKKH